MLVKHFFFTLTCFACGYSAQLFAQSTPSHADNTSQTAANAIFVLPIAGSNSFVTPRVIRYDGILKRQPSSTGVAVVFSVYGSGDSTKPLWQETQSVQPEQDGRYTAFLGVTGSSELPSFILTATGPQWLGVRVAGENNEQRTLLTKTPFVGKASAGSVPTPGKVIGNSNSLPVQQKTTAQQTGLSGLAIGTAFSSSLPTLPPDSGSGSPLPIVSHEIIANNATEAFTVQQDGTGIGTHVTAQTNNALLAETTSTSTAQNTILSINHAPNGTGIRAESQASTGSGSGVWGVSAGDHGTGVVGEATQSSGTTYGLRGISASDGGIGVFGVNSSASGAATGVRGESNSPDGTAGVFDSLGGGNILSGRSAGVEKFHVDAQGNVTSTAFSGDGSKLTNINASLLGGLSASDLLKSVVFNGDGSQLSNVNANTLEGLHAADFARIGLPQNVNGLETLASKQLALNSDSGTAIQFGAAAVAREDQDIGHPSAFFQAGSQMHFRLTRAYCDKTSASQQTPSDQTNYFCVPDAVTIDDAHPASSTPSKDFIIAPYKYGMGVTYPGLIEVASSEFSLHAQSPSFGAHLWIGDEHDLGGILTTAHDAMNSDKTIDRSQSFVSLTSETFTGSSHGDMLFSVRDPQDNFRFQFGPLNAAEAPGIYQQYTKARIDSSGKGFFDGGTQTGGADFAESVSIAGRKNNYEPGDVLMIDPNSDRQFTLAKTPYSTLVAGIYSTKPGVTATPHTSEDPRLAGEVPLAIVGIVPCKVTNENGPIARGDLLVTSSTPGYAMRGSDRTLLSGAVIGKALQPFSGVKGKIEVLVTLR
jgi:hypothetical protein